MRANIWEILAHVIPDALIVDRSAGPVMFEGDTLFVASGARTRDLPLPGLRVAVRRGHNPFSDDPPWVAGLRKSSTARALVENLAASRARATIARTLSDAELESWVAQLAQQHPAERLSRIRDRARDLADELGQASRFPRLDEMFGAALGTRTAVHGGLLHALGRGDAWDVARLARFTDLAERLGDGSLDPEPPGLPVLNKARVRERPFFEAYLSNFIEGTEFTVDEAIGLIYDHATIPRRSADSHDVVSTYELIHETTEAGVPLESGHALVATLQRWHARLMAPRLDKHPGELKQIANRVGSYHFVTPELAKGTLERGFALLDQIQLPFARAVYVMFLISEVHPFDDGNGRLARLMMNAELSAAGQHRILIPLIVRNDYLSGLRRLSREGDPRLLVRVLANAWRWSAQVDFSTLESARTWLDRTNALVDARDAERAGQYLILPADLEPEPRDTSV